MKRLIHLTLATQMICGSFASAEAFETLDANARLRRLSLITRGRDAGNYEKASLLRTVPGAQEKWFAKKAKEYTSSDEFQDKMMSNLSKLFRIREPRTSYNTRVTSMHLLFHKILSENLSWDNILTSQTFAIAKDSNLAGGINYYKGAISEEKLRGLEDYFNVGVLNQIEKEMGNGSNVDGIDWNNKGVPVESDSPRIAGVLTDPHFLERYWTTPINQNRKRAAAIFRIFLCDEMRAVILPDASALKAIEEAGLDKSSGGAGPMSKAQTSLAARHATDQKCATCHTKLDPLANVFRSGSNRLPSRPIPGALTYKRRSGELVQVPFRTAQELAQALVKQPEYASCQVRHFWDWFIGSDVALSPEMETNLVQKFNEVGRRPREFANYLVNLKDFYNFPKLTLDKIEYRHVGGLLRDCQSCHDMEVEAPRLSKLPFDDSLMTSHDRIVEKVIQNLDLLGDGGKASMPPQRAGWKVNTADRARLMAWLANGAPDDNGKATWSNPQLQGQLKLRLAAERINFDLRPTFDFTAHRRLTTTEFAKQLQYFIAEVNPTATNYFSSYIQPEYDGGSTIEFDLESGSGISNPSSAYARQLKSISKAIDGVFGSKLVEGDAMVLKRLNLIWMLDLPPISPLVDTTPIESGEPVSLEVCQKIGESLFVQLFGTVPTPAEQQQIQRYAELLVQSKAPAEKCVRNTLTQLFWSSRNLIY